MRRKFEDRVKLLRSEGEQFMKMLEQRHTVYLNILKGHSYQSLTGLVPAAAERLQPTSADLMRETEMTERPRPRDSSSDKAEASAKEQTTEF